MATQRDVNANNFPRRLSRTDERVVELAEQFTPETPSDWDVEPTAQDGALDELAARTKALEGVSPDIITTTEGDIIVADSNGDADRLPIGAADTLLVSDGTTVGYAKATSANLSNTDSAVRVQRIAVGYAALNAATTGVAALFGTAIPNNAIIKQVWYEVLTSFADNGTSLDTDTSTIQMGLEDQDNDVLAAVTIEDGSGALLAGIYEGIPTGLAATMLKLSAARQLAVTWTAGTGNSTALTAGAMDVFVEWVPGN